MALTIDVDLQVEVDGIPGRLVTDGSALVVHSPRPVAFARAAMPRGGDRRSAREAFEQLPTGQIHEISFRGPHGEVVRIGRDRRRPQVRPSALVRPRIARAATAIAVGAAIAALAAALRRRPDPRPARLSR